MPQKNVVLCYPVSEPDVQKIRSAIGNVKVIVSSQDQIAKDLFAADVFCGHAKVPVDWAGVIEQGRLLWIQSSAAGLDHCLVPEVVESSVLVSGCSALFANQVAEQTMALLYGVLRRTPTFIRAQDQQQYQRLPTDTLHGKTVAIIGLGGNGRRIAALLKDTAGEILATDTFPDYAPLDYVATYSPAKMNALFERADIVIVTLPLTKETKYCIGREQLTRLKPGSYFINVARGQVVDHAALWEAIETGVVAWAGLDVFDPEPPPQDSSFWHCENVLLSPHVGAQSRDRVPLTTELFCLNYARFQNRQTLINQVDKTLEFPRPEHRLAVDRRGNINLPSDMDGSAAAAVK